MKRNILTILFFCVLIGNAYAVSDSVSYVATGNCCYNLTVKNRNTNMVMLDRIIVISPGKILSASAPQYWIVQKQTADSVVYVHTGGANYLMYGTSVSGFSVCFMNGSLVNVNWETYQASIRISTGIFSVTCSIIPDSLSYAVNGNCCFDFTVKNRNSRNQFINRFVIKAPGRIVSATAPPNWLMTKNADSVIFSTGSSQFFILPGNSLAGFVVCFTNTGPVNAAWTMSYFFDQLSSGSIALQCSRQKDMVTALADYNCQFIWVITNKNNSGLAINDFHLTILTPGVSFGNIDTVTYGKSDFILRSHTPTTTDFVTRAPFTGIQPGGLPHGLPVIQFNTPGLIAGVDSFKVEWRTTNNQMVLSVDTLWLKCKRTCDVLSGTTNPGSCCTLFALFNQNWQRLPINDLHITINTPGVTFESIQAMGPLMITNSTPTSVDLASRLPGDVIPPGAAFSSLLLTCMNIPRTGQNAWINLTYQTTNNGQVLCEDTLGIFCTGRTPLKDSVTAEQQYCCYNLTLKNRNEAQVPITAFEIEVLAPGWSIGSSPGTPNDWSILSMTPRDIKFVTDANPLLPGSDLSGFQLCFTSVSTAAFQVIWKSFGVDGELSRDTVWVQCAQDKSGRDSLMWSTVTGPMCVNMVTVMNRNPLKIPITDFHIEVLSPGWYITGQPTSPPKWNVISYTATTVNYLSNGAPIAAGAALGGFNFMIDTDLPPTPYVKFLWRTTQPNGVISQDTMMTFCLPTERCDSVGTAQAPNESCCTRLTIKNKHRGKSISDIRLSISSGFSFSSASSTNPSWTLKSNTGQKMLLGTSGLPLAPRDTISGLRVCLDREITAPDTAWITWETMSGNEVLCTSKFAVRCQYHITGQDSISTEKMGGDCCFDATVHNRHLTQSPIDLVSFAIKSPGAMFAQTVGTPNGWQLVTQSTTMLVFRSQTNQIPTGGKQSGFNFCFTTSPQVTYPINVEWTTSYAGKYVSVGTLQVDCRQTAQRCDSINATKRIGSCCYDLVVKNRNPNMIDEVYFSVLTPNVSLNLPQTQPIGWGVSVANAVSGSIRTLTATIPSQGFLSGFSLCLLKAPGSADIVSILWQTKNQGRVVCTDTLRLICGNWENRCDSITISGPSNSVCCFDYSLANMHMEKPPITQWHLFIRTPGITISGIPTTPSGWAIQNLQPNQVSFNAPSAAALQSGYIASPFNICYNNIQSGQTVSLLAVSVRSDQSSCNDTVHFRCTTTGVEQYESIKIPQIELYQNYPNPFHSTSLIKFDLPNADVVEMTVEDLSGRKLMTLLDGFREAGRYTVQFDAKSLPPGTFVYRLRTRTQIVTRLLTIIK